MTISMYKISCGSTNRSLSATETQILNNHLLKEAPALRTKSQLNNIIVSKNNTPDHLAINIYWDTLRSLYKHKKSIAKSNGLYLNYQKLCEIHGASHEAIRKKLVKLEKLGLINRSFQHGDILNKSFYNQLIIYVWKITPYFLVPFGSDKEEITNLSPSTNQNYIAQKYNIIFENLNSQSKAPLKDGGKND